MNKIALTSSILAVAFATVIAEGASADDSKGQKCRINSDGKSLIRADKADCASKNSSCAGTNAAGDPNAWIYLPNGVCDSIEGGEVVK